MSKLTPGYETVSKAGMGLKQMEDERPAMGTKSASHQTVCSPIKPLTNIAPMEKANSKSKAWKPLGRK